MKEPPDIHFWHIPKTAGTSVAGMIRRAYAPKDCIPAHTLLELAALDSKIIPSFRCYTGHFFSVLEPLVGRPLPTVSILRNPLDQTLSLLQHCQNYVRGAGITAPLTARLMPFLWNHIPVLRGGIERRWCPILMNNFQTRVLGSDIQWPIKLSRNFYGITYPFLAPSFCEPEPDFERLYACAVQRLQNMAVVGTVERLADTVKLVFDLLGVQQPPNVPRDNESGNRFRPSADFTRLIAQKNEYDLKLYAVAKNLLEVQLASRLK
jgi:hypothetical protein